MPTLTLFESLNENTVDFVNATGDEASSLTAHLAESSFTQASDISPTASIAAPQTTPTAPQTTPTAPRKRGRPKKF